MALSCNNADDDRLPETVGEFEPGGFRSSARDAWWAEMTRLVLAAAVLAMQIPGASALFGEGSTQYVGIRYWLQDEQDGAQLTEAETQAGRRYHVHLRSNVDGFLVVFLTADGSELTTRTYPTSPGLLLGPDRGLTLPGTFQKAQAESLDRLVILLARSQTEVVSTAHQALEKLTRVSPDLISETIAKGPDIGTFVVNRSGNQAAATIRLTR